MKRINKLLISLMILILCSGCSINYEIEITKDNVKETIDTTDTIFSDRTKEDIYNEYQSWFPVYINAFGDELLEYDISTKFDNVEYHQKSINEIDNGYHYTYKYTYPINKFNNASSLRQAYAKRNFYIGKEYISINTDSTNLLCNYSYFEDLNVTISVDKNIYNVDYNNAHNISGNKYIWKLNRNNCKESKIILTLKYKELNTEPNNSETPNNKGNQNKNNGYVMYIFYGILIILVIVGYFIIKNIKNKGDKFDI